MSKRNCLSLNHESVVGYCRIRLDFCENDRCRELCCSAAAVRIRRRNGRENRRADMGSNQIHRLHGSLALVRRSRLVVAEFVRRGVLIWPGSGYRIAGLFIIRKEEICMEISSFLFSHFLRVSTLFVL